VLRSCYNRRMSDAADFSVDSSAHPSEAHAWALKATGDLDMESAPKLTEAVKTLADQGAALIVLDLTDVSFLDSTGLRAIVSANTVLEAHGGRLMIDGMSGAARRVLEITSLLEHYTHQRDADPA
jgi:anti-sigma B factor antagonist